MTVNIIKASEEGTGNHILNRKQVINIYSYSKERKDCELSDKQTFFFFFFF